jgi:XTP/dITP diphosphohydrolase
MKRYDLMIATKNLNKVKEIKKIITGYDVNIMTFIDFPQMPDVVEDGSTIEENSKKKAIETAKYTGLVSIADDTGLFVDAINGEPGVFSARWAGEDATYMDNNQKLIEKLSGFKYEERTATFRCAITLAMPSGFFVTEVGEIKGYIIDQLRGENGFGYDPLFYLPEYKKTFAEMDMDLKNRISHRAIALSRIGAVIKKVIENGKI